MAINLKGSDATTRMHGPRVSSWRPRGPRRQTARGSPRTPCTTRLARRTTPWRGAQAAPCSPERAPLSELASRGGPLMTVNSGDWGLPRRGGTADKKSAPAGLRSMASVRGQGGVRPTAPRRDVRGAALRWFHDLFGCLQSVRECLTTTYSTARKQNPTSTQNFRLGNFVVGF